MIKVFDVIVKSNLHQSYDEASTAGNITEREEGTALYCQIKAKNGLLCKLGIRVLFSTETVGYFKLLRNSRHDFFLSSVKCKLIMSVVSVDLLLN